MSGEFAALTARNRALLEGMFTTPKGFGRGCVDHIADLAHCRLIGTTCWSGTFRTKFDWAQHVFFALPRELDGLFEIVPEQILVEGDLACVRARGRARVKNGRRYDNDYCLVYRLAAGCIVELAEYLDTALITHAFGGGRPALQPGVMERHPAVAPASYASSALVSDAPATVANKAAIRALFDGPAAEYGARYLALMADDVVYRIQGTTRFSGVYRGKADVVARLFEPLVALLDGGIQVIADRVFGEGDWVVAQARGLARARNGRRYDNDYCLLYRMRDGRIVEVIEYLDTELVAWAFG
jgi:hypothetical protein